MEATSILEGAIQKIEQFTKENGILLFTGGIIESLNNHVEWREDDPAGIDEYLQIAKTLAVKVLILDTELNEVEKDSPLIKAYYKGLNKENKAHYDKALAVVEQNSGKPARISLSFISEGTAYTYRLEAEWIDQYDIVELAYDPEGDEDDD